MMGLRCFTSLASKLRDLKTEPRKFNTKYYSYIPVRVGEAREELHQFQRSIQNATVTEDQRVKENDLLCRNVELREVEEDFYRQTSRVSWLNSGDKKTWGKFCHP